MAYISNEEISEKRKLIKKVFPKWKFSIRNKHHSTLIVTILESDIDFNAIIKEDRGHETINEFYYKEHYKDFPEIVECLEKILNIMLKGNEIVSEDSDYGSIPNFYVSLRIGEWDKKFVFKEK